MMGVTYGVVTFSTSEPCSLRWAIPATRLPTSLVVVGVSVGLFYASDGGAGDMSAPVASPSIRKFGDVGSSEGRSVPVTKQPTSAQILLGLRLETPRFSIAGRELTSPFGVSSSLGASSETFSSDEGAGLAFYIPLRSSCTVASPLGTVVAFLLTCVATCFLVIRTTTKLSFSC